MKKNNVLYSADEIHASIKRIFSEPKPSDDRVALVAYVGGDGDSYLPHPEGLRIICNPSPGGTDPDTIRRLIKRGARVEFSDKLHMKVYWSRNRGCIITSANASTSALGVSGLKEAGVLFPAGFVDIKRLIKYSRPRPVTKTELQKLDRHTRVHKRTVEKREQKKGTAPDFLTWYHLPYCSIWKLIGCVDLVSGNAKAVKEMTFSEYGFKQPFDWISVDKKKVHKTDWILSFLWNERRVTDLKWIYADFIVKISPKEKRYYCRSAPYHAVQVHGMARCSLPPFRLNGEFRKALRYAIKKYTPERIMDSKSDIPPKRFLKFIADAMSK